MTTTTETAKPSDALAEALAQILERNNDLRSRYGHVGGLLVLTKAKDDVPRLVAAIRAVLKLADSLEPQAPAASALEEDRMWVRQQCAEMIREAVRLDLTPDTPAA